MEGIAFKPAVAAAAVAVGEGTPAALQALPPFALVVRFAAPLPCLRTDGPTPDPSPWQAPRRGGPAVPCHGAPWSGRLLLAALPQERLCREEGLGGGSTRGARSAPPLATRMGNKSQISDHDGHQQRWPFGSSTEQQ